MVTKLHKDTIEISLMLLGGTREDERDERADNKNVMNVEKPWIRHCCVCVVWLERYTQEDNLEEGQST